MIANLLSTADTESSVNLTWSLDNQCVVVYHVEVTNTNTSNITNMNTTSQYIILTLQTSVVYSFRVRGADSAGRGEWSEQSMFTPGELKVYRSCILKRQDACALYCIDYSYRLFSYFYYSVSSANYHYIISSNNSANINCCSHRYILLNNVP